MYFRTTAPGKLFNKVGTAYLGAPVGRAVCPFYGLASEKVRSVAASCFLGNTEAVIP